VQDRYTGDIGDYVKYGLLRALSPGYSLGVAWYLYPDEGHNKDGRHIDYLDAPNRWRTYDPVLFDGLQDIVEIDDRRVSAIENSALLNGVTYHNEVLDPSKERAGVSVKAWRQFWFERLLAKLKDCDLVFADPDNGFCGNDKFSHSRVKDWKRLPLDEAKRISRGRSAVFYHHNTRRPGGHKAEIEYWCECLGGDVMALRWRAYSARTFFLVNPTPVLRERLIKFTEGWGPKAELHSS
jgi:hypothetical protein